MPNPLTKTYSQFRTSRFNQGKIDGFTEACTYAEYHLLTRQEEVIPGLWPSSISSHPRDRYWLGYSIGVRLAQLYFLILNDLSHSPSQYISLRDREIESFYAGLEEQANAKG